MAAVLVPSVIGITAAIGQIVLMREEVALFNGNEVSVGIVLAAWLLWTASGNSLISLLPESWKHRRSLIAAGACVSGLSLAATVWALRETRMHLQAVPGQTLGPVPMVFSSIVCFSVFCGLCGCQFSLAAKMYRQNCAVSGKLATSYAYLYETVGFAGGAVLTGIVLQRHFGSFQIATIAALLNISMALWLTIRMFWWKLLLAASATALSVFLIARVAPELERSTQERLWRGFNLVLTQESIYGRIMILDSGGMRSIYQNGTIVANVPDQASAEESVHYALLEHPNPKKVMLIGGGLNGSVLEALKHRTIEQLNYLELDPTLIEVYRREFPAEWSNTFVNPRVRLHAVDGRQYLNSSNEKFDELIVNISDPENAQLNRFYTEEFYQMARDHLAPGGLIAVQLHASEDTVSPSLEAYLQSIHRTLQGVFPFVAVIPGGTVHYFGAMQSGVLTEDPQLLIRRLEARQIETQYVREYVIPFRMASDRMTEIHRLLRPVSSTKSNRDFLPVAYYFSATLWSAQFRDVYARVLHLAGKAAFWKITASCVLALALVSGVVGLSRGWTRSAAACSVLATGFSLMAVQILVLFTFQSMYGYVYEELAVLTGMFMAGVAVGTWLGIRQIRKVDHSKLARAAVAGQLAVAGSVPLLLMIVTLISRDASGGIPLQASRAAFPLLAGLCGIPGGFQFPVACAIYEGQRSRSRSAILYSFDLAGGCCGALLLSGILIPVFGFWMTAWLAAILSLVPAILLTTARRTSPSTS